MTGKRERSLAELGVAVRRVRNRAGDVGRIARVNGCGRRRRCRRGCNRRGRQAGHRRRGVPAGRPLPKFLRAVSPAPPVRVRRDRSARSGASIGCRGLGCRSCAALSAATSALSCAMVSLKAPASCVCDSSDDATICVDAKRAKRSGQRADAQSQTRSPPRAAESCSVDQQARADQCGPRRAPDRSRRVSPLNSATAVVTLWSVTRLRDAHRVLRGLGLTRRQSWGFDVRQTCRRLRRRTRRLQPCSDSLFASMASSRLVIHQSVTMFAYQLVTIGSGPARAGR